MKKLFYTIMLGISVLAVSSCEQFLTVQPEDALTAEN